MCKKLRFVPTLPPRLQYFDAHGCDSLERVANPLASPVLSDQIHATFIFSNCNKLDQDAKDTIISYTRRRSQLVLDELTRYNGGLVLEALIGTCFPGWEVPAWFRHRASGSVLNPKLSPHWSGNKFTGIGLCAVIVFDGYHNERKRVLVKCNCEFKNEDGSSVRFSCTVGGWSEPSNGPRKMESSHVFIGFTSRLDINKISEVDNEEKCVCTETSIEFEVTDGTEEIKGCEVVKCGFSLLYATDELQVEPGVGGASVKAKQYRAYSKNVVISNVREDAETAERSADGGCEIVEAHRIATTPQPPITKSPATPPEYGTGYNLARERRVRASNVDTLSSRGPQQRNANLIPIVSSTSADGLRQNRPRVFVSFHGTKLQVIFFVENLVKDLTVAGVNVYTGYHNGIGIKPEQVYKRIEESMIALVIFSKTYLESNFCLNELVMVGKLAKEGQLLVIPVFFDVGLTDVKYLEGKFGRRFKEMKERYKDEPEKVLKWETSLMSIANTIGISSEVYGKYELVEATARMVQRGLSNIYGGKPSSLGKLATIVAFLICLALFFTQLLF